MAPWGPGEGPAVARSATYLAALGPLVLAGGRAGQAINPHCGGAGRKSLGGLPPFGPGTQQIRRTLPRAGRSGCRGVEVSRRRPSRSTRTEGRGGTRGSRPSRPSPTGRRTRSACSSSSGPATDYPSNAHEQIAAGPRVSAAVTEVVAGVALPTNCRAAPKWLIKPSPVRPLLGITA